MKTEVIFLVEDSPEGGYEAHALGHAIYTYADTLDELRLMIEDAVACHFDEGERPSRIYHILQPPDGKRAQRAPGLKNNAV